MEATSLPIGLQRLLQLAEHLEHGKLGHEKFYFSVFNAEFGDDGIEDVGIAKCGTLGCAIGECPIVWPTKWEFGNNGLPKLYGNYGAVGGDAAVDFFDLSLNEVDHLFYPGSQNEVRYGGVYLSEEATKEEVAANIRQFVAIKSQALEAQTNG